MGIWKADIVSYEGMVYWRYQSAMKLCGRDQCRSRGEEYMRYSRSMSKSVGEIEDAM